MHTRSWTWLLGFTKLLTCLALVTSLWGCSAQYEMIPTAAGWPTSAQAERDAVLYAIPPDLRARLDAVVKANGHLAENAGTNRQFVAQMPSPEMLFENKLLETVLEWAAEKTTDERLTLQTRQMQAIPHYEVIRWTEKGEPQPASHVEFAKGAAVGGVIGVVPLGPVIADVAIELRILPKSGYWARVGRTCGEFASGVVQMGIGCAGISGGVGMSGTGGGSVVGVPLVVGSYAILANGATTTYHALQQGAQLLREGPPPDADPPQPEIRLLEKPKAQPAPTPVAAPAKPAAAAQPAAPAKPATPAKPAAPAKPAKAAPVETTTTTYDRTTKVTTTTKASGTTTETRPRVKGKPAEATTSKQMVAQPSTTPTTSSATNGHHPWPKYLGGPAKQDLAQLSESLHKSYHSGLDKILPRQRGTAYYDNLSPLAKQQLMRDLAAYTKAFDAKYGTRLYDSMTRNGFPTTP